VLFFRNILRLTDGLFEQPASLAREAILDKQTVEDKAQEKARRPCSGPQDS
jgi:hypothetical protein